MNDGHTEPFQQASGIRDRIKGVSTSTLKEWMGRCTQLANSVLVGTPWTGEAQDRKTVAGELRRVKLGLDSGSP